jgi:hypothetical protein
MFTKLLGHPPTPLGQAKVGLKIAPGVEAVVMRGLMRDPSKRYAGVQEFAAALRDAAMHASSVAADGAAAEDDETLLARARALFRGRRKS